ncbi:anthocyanidin 3-O-glucosyltransferase 7-like [Macadamia integrifolia]|uniref:anthocyanidin 3-O-glucosyltransferase 7-like n=1 Tax=Macadamia integrifolia TaxID=60698 RepID=UPI001C4F18EE|nr:anthocyanidin 3-O-glucosyltransferase 7-like [Macadamia integrifolia]
MAEETKKPQIVVLAFPFGTHADPLLSLTYRLALADPELSFSFLCTAQSNHSIFRSNPNPPLPNLKPYNVDDGIPNGYEFKGNPLELIGFFLRAAPVNFKKAMEEAIADVRNNISCLITDAFFWFAADMADELGVPWIPLWTAGPPAVSIHVYTDLIRSKIGVGPHGITGREDEVIGFLPGLSSIRIRDLPEGVVSGNMEMPFSKMLHQMGKMLRRGDAVVVNSFEELNPTAVEDLRSKFKQFLPVGPFNLWVPQRSIAGDDQTGCLSWLNSQSLGSVVYVSFGTVITSPTAELAALAKGLEAIGAPFLWSLKEASTSQLPDGFLDRTKERAMVVPWVPQPRVLSHVAVGAFVTHGGWNSVLESITGGVPMICRPFLGDQTLNGRWVSSVWGIGITTEGGPITERGLVDGLDLILWKEEGRIMRDKVRRLRMLAEEAVGPNGSSTRNFQLLLKILRTRISQVGTR